MAASVGKSQRSRPVPDKATATERRNHSARAKPFFIKGETKKKKNMAVVRFGKTTPLGHAKVPAAAAAPVSWSSNLRERRSYIGRLGRLLTTAAPRTVARSLWEAAHIGRVDPLTAWPSPCTLQPMVSINATRADRPPLDKVWQVATNYTAISWRDDIEAVLAWLDGPGRKEVSTGHFARARLLDGPSTLVVEIVWRHTVSGDVLCIDLGTFCDAVDRAHRRDSGNATPFALVTLFWVVIVVMVAPALACAVTLASLRNLLLPFC
ncbi:hypothetical protein psal_cds_133 [Pandoravirus salinus]|uniref:Uncharacterized protein n=1 Tax=Pandoravirus salinus TaxID=1349410 RepID=S4VT18_9VIRU|nr:hypothetical protein psal_cds_133 [Pandoravirus salinus]AGO83589.1 hypothetical protein psal_cds_133 [Pandoravirus salinus]